MGNSSRILFVGGCHLNGYPVGEGYAFTHVALGCLSEHGENPANVLPFFNLRSGPRIVAACREWKPDAVVLQLGHYESPRPLKKTLRRKSSKKIHTEDPGKVELPRPDLQYGRTVFMTTFELRRIAAAGMIIALGRKRRMFDPAAIADSLDSILVSLKDLPLRGIVLVGPFSAPDPVTRCFRRRAVPIFEAAAKKHNCTFVDVFSSLESYPKGPAFHANFADPQHLSVLGHQRVGVLVGAALKKVLEQSTATEAEPVMAAPIREVARATGPRWAGRPAVALRS